MVTTSLISDVGKSASLVIIIRYILQKNPWVKYIVYIV